LLSSVKRKAIATFAGGASLALLSTTGIVFSPAASAAPSAPAPASATNNLVAVGSDTIFCVDNDFGTVGTNGGIFAQYNAAQSTNATFDVPPTNVNLGCQTPPATYAVPADGQHPAETWEAAPSGSTCPPVNVAGAQYPFGSSAGITCFVGDQGAGNVAFARSSRGRGSADPSNLEFWAFALDGVGWVHNSKNTHTPASLTPTQLQGIYNCTFTDWSQVGGTAGPITRDYPQVGSGTGKFFAQVFLNGVYPTSTMSCPVTFVAENDGTQVAAADKVSAILPYSLAALTAQKNVAIEPTNLGKGFLFGQVNGTTLTLANVSEEAAIDNTAASPAPSACTDGFVETGYCGSRYVYHVTWDGAVAPAGSFGLPAAYYAATITLIGVPSSGTAGANSICNNTYSTVLKKFGFRPLAKAVTNQPGSFVPANVASGTKGFCRLY
jgi:ABC-type phosphate transport system substrate-binding protein